MSAIQLKAIRESFFTAVFSLLGHIANCDGYINRNEIRRTQAYMDKMELSAHCRNEAIHLFRAGASPTFNIYESLTDFREAAQSKPNIIQVLLVYVISMARTDGKLVKKEMDVVKQVADTLGYSSIVFDHLLNMIVAQDTFEKTASSGQSKHEKPEHDDPDYSKYSFTNHFRSEQLAAFAALGLAPTASEMEIKKAYRKLANQFHPDKLIGQGLPPDLLNAATDRFRKIQVAYEILQKHKKSSL